jgi:hypothetical protein
MIAILRISINNFNQSLPACTVVNKKALRLFCKTLFRITQ